MPDKQISNLATLVGRNIADRRKGMGMSQEELAQRLNVAPSSLSRIENGYSAPKFERLTDIASALECQVADLFRDSSRNLAVYLDAIEDMLRTLRPQSQEDVVQLISSAVRMFNRANHKHDQS